MPNESFAHLSQRYPRIVEEATSEAVHLRRVLTSGDPQFAYLLENDHEQNIWLRCLLTAALDADLMMAWAQKEQA